MLLSDIYEQLSKGEIRQLAVSQTTNTVENSENANYLLPHVNLALSVLHRRFPLRTSSLIIELQDGITEYTIHKRFAVSNIDSVEPVRYILDTEENPYLDDMTKVLKVYDALGNEYELNKPGHSDSIVMKTLSTLYVPFPKQGDIVQVVYQADHPRLINANLSPEEVEIDLPWAFLEPLIYHISSRLHAAMPNMNGQSQQMTYIQLFEKACNEIEDKNMLQREQAGVDSFVRDGWV